MMTATAVIVCYRYYGLIYFSEGLDTFIHPLFGLWLYIIVVLKVMHLYHVYRTRRVKAFTVFLAFSISAYPRRSKREHTR